MNTLRILLLYAVLVFISLPARAQTTYKTTNTSNQYAGQWTKIASATIASRYQYSNAVIQLSGGSSSGYVGVCKIFFRVKQQAEFSNAPYVQLELIERNNSRISKDDIKAVIVDLSGSGHTGSSTVELYLKVTNSYEIVEFAPLLINNIPPSFYGGQGYSADLPAGVQIDCSYRHSYGLNGYFEGYLGVGTATPNALVHIERDYNGENVLRVRNTSPGTAACTMIRLNNDLSTSSASHALLFLNSSQRTTDGGVNTLTLRNNIGDTQIHAQGSAGLRIKANTGNVGIGTSTPDSKLTVRGIIHAEEVKVDLNVPGPDYVFEANYPLLPLEETKVYIDQHKHLPGIPSSAEMQLNGVNLLEMNMKLLEKVEELTLHQIALLRQLEEHKQQLEKVHQQVKLLSENR